MMVEVCFLLFSQKHIKFATCTFQIHPNTRNRSFSKTYNQQNRNTCTFLSAIYTLLPVLKKQQISTNKTIIFYLNPLSCFASVPSNGEREKRDSDGEEDSYGVKREKTQNHHSSSIFSGQRKKYFYFVFLKNIFLFFFQIFCLCFLMKMIKEALMNLKEKNGSSPYAIAKQIEEKYKPLLPENFRKTLSLQLKNSVAKGKLVKIRASYKLSETTTRTTRQQQKKKMETRSKKTVSKPEMVTTKKKRKAKKPRQLKSIKSPGSKKVLRASAS